MRSVLEDDRRNEGAHREIAEVVAPVDVVGRQAVVNGSVWGRRIEQRCRGGGGASPRRPCEQEAAVRICRAGDGGEPPGADRERGGQRVGEGQRLLRVVAHWLHRAGRSHEPVHLTAIDLHVCGLPALSHVLRLGGIRHREGRDGRRSVLRSGVAVGRLTLGVKRQPPGQASEQVVKRMVLHHHDDDVVERHVGVDRAQRLVREGQATGTALGHGCSGTHHTNPLTRVL